MFQFPQIVAASFVAKKAHLMMAAALLEDVPLGTPNVTARLKEARAEAEAAGGDMPGVDRMVTWREIAIWVGRDEEGNVAWVEGASLWKHEETKSAQFAIEVFRANVDCLKEERAAKAQQERELAEQKAAANAAAQAVEAARRETARLMQLARVEQEIAAAKAMREAQFEAVVEAEANGVAIKRDFSSFAPVARSVVGQSATAMGSWAAQVDASRPKLTVVNVERIIESAEPLPEFDRIDAICIALRTNIDRQLGFATSAQRQSLADRLIEIAESLREESLAM